MIISILSILENNKLSSLRKKTMHNKTVDLYIPSELASSNKRRKIKLQKKQSFLKQMQTKLSLNCLQNKPTPLFSN